MKKKLPVVSRPTPAAAQTELTAKPVGGGSRPEFPTRDSMYRSVGLIGASLLAGGIATADTKPAPPQPAKPVDAKAPQKEPAPPKPDAPKADVALKDGAVDGAAIDLKKQPKFKVYREGGGIGPPEDMWEPGEVEAFINWTLAKEGKYQLKTKYKLDYDGQSIVLDAFDANAKIGYIYNDKLDQTPISKEQNAKIAAWLKAKKVAILVIDQNRTPDQATLRGKIVKFVADVKKAPMAPGELVNDSQRAEGQYKMTKDPVPPSNPPPPTKAPTPTTKAPLPTPAPTKK